MQRAAAAAVAAVQVGASVPAMAGVGAPGLSGGAPQMPAVPAFPFPPQIEPEPTDELGAEAAPDEINGSLAAVAKAAALKAERAAIEHTLRQVHWNRRKAAQILGVSYKTLLNKIKECGISRA
jgi:DNA-binding NtrC family response regulator